jgi:5'-methylthioadenosine phosphorylase
MQTAAIGVIGGSGLYAMEGVEDLEEVTVDTPFGSPSDALTIGVLDGTAVAFLPRHGRGHRFPPHQINYRANLWALRSVGVRWLMSVSAVGSMREAIVPGDLVLCDQFIDRTRTRPTTFFEDGVAAHVGFAEPCCEVLRGALRAAATAEALSFHPRGTYVCIEGPQFSTRAESLLFRSWGVDVVGMTNLPEARLAREAQIAYATIAMATDYDCWHEGEEDVTVEGVIAVLRANVSRAQRLIRAAVPRLAALPPSPAWRALEGAIMTRRDLLDAATLERVGLFVNDTQHHGGRA